MSDKLCHSEVLKVWNLVHLERGGVNPLRMKERCDLYNVVKVEE